MGASTRLIEAFREVAKSYSRYSAESFFRFAKSRDLSPAQLGTLLHLNKDEAQGVVGLGGRMSVTSAAASQMVDRLVLAGFVERSEDQEDRRVRRVRLSDKGESTIEDFGRERQAWIEALAASVTEEEERALMRALEIVIEKTKDITKEHQER